MEQREGVSVAGEVGRADSAGNKELKYQGERGSTGEQQEPSAQLRTRKGAGRAAQSAAWDHSTSLPDTSWLAPLLSSLSWGVLSNLGKV